ncbi:MAG: prepilin peptidase [Candidatus Thorarchaeota archaeon]
MVFVITAFAIAAFICTVIVLLINSIWDFRARRVPNQMAFTGLVGAVVFSVLSDRIFEQPMTYLTSILLTLVLGYVLFKIGALGGADVKALLAIAIISPGVEFATWGNPILEAILIVGLLFMATLMIGYVLSKKKTDENDIIPLIPIIMGVYLALQLLAFL